MTNVARPTWAPAKGGNEQGGTRIFGPSQKKEGQDTKDELHRRNLWEELEDRERRHFSSKDNDYEDRDRRKSGQLLLEGAKREIEDHIVPRSADADDDIDVKSYNESEDDDDDDEDDTEALMAELEQIKKEKAEEKLRKSEGKSGFNQSSYPSEYQQSTLLNSKQEEELKAKEADLLKRNPLINQPTSFSVKRRWDDDVVFMNQACGELKVAKRFINDTIRNDFHRKFHHKYMKYC
ncbi:hypothetical protein RND71_037752 [Anisodus tanguticus]|uniref:Uncharacterized protein n=1 Tax=Anisodus tanguticus TaxID=243964 RepID=A0AAE1UWC2_9SOLA|nr:hypothetical protein RND71_037752 [Anisodus tanguticus]